MPAPTENPMGKLAKGTLIPRLPSVVLRAVKMRMNVKRNSTATAWPSLSKGLGLIGLIESRRLSGVILFKTN